jgi:SAM-dependent methyltransferase
LAGDERWAFHYTDDALTRYLRDRRLTFALDVLQSAVPLSSPLGSALVVCGGVGGEGTYLRNHGFADVTVSDFSRAALDKCNRFDPRLKTLLLNAEHMDLPDSSYDIVVVQDGLHHLPRPALGFTEMLRIARVAAVVIEPHLGLAGRIAGREWEVHGPARNYVFRWDRMMLEQCTRSFLLSRSARVLVKRVWDHGSAVAKMVGRVPAPLRLLAARGIYGCLAPFSRCGNMMIGVILKDGDAKPERLTSH